MPRLPGPLRSRPEPTRPSPEISNFRSYACFNRGLQGGGRGTRADLPRLSSVSYAHTLHRSHGRTHRPTRPGRKTFPIDVAAILRACTAKQLIVAGGIKERREIDELDAMGVDAVAGMAVYSGAIEA